MRVTDIVGKFKHHIKKAVGRNQPFIPEELRRDDVFVVSYPKSGNTWVRFLLANALYPGADVDFHTIHGLVPEVGKEDMRRATLPPPRILKSHAPYRAAYPRVIYILRDGRDVYTSYYHYRKPNLPDGTTFEDFLRGDHWPTRWAAHVQGWVDAASARDDILVVRFEDLKDDSARELRRMLDFIGETYISANRIQEAVEESSFHNMRRLEEKRGRKYGPDTRFVRKGKAGSHQELFTQKAREIIWQEEGRMLRNLGYENS